MISWFRRVSGDLLEIPACIAFYEKEAEESRKELDMYNGETIERHAGTLPGYMEYRFNQLQEIDAILEFLNIQLKSTRSERFVHYFEHYNRTLTYRDVEKYLDGDKAVVSMMELVNEFALIRNIFGGIIRGIESKNYMISNIVKLRVAGLDDARL